MGDVLVIETKNINKTNNAMNNFKIVQQSGISKFEKLDNWLEKESQLYKSEIKSKKKSYIHLKRGTIVKIDFGVNPGSELCHTHFAIVISKHDNTKNETITVIPLTSKPGIGRLPLNNLIKDEIVKNIKNKLAVKTDSKELWEILNEYKRYTNFSYAYISQITTVSKSRLIYSKNKFDIINKTKCSADILSKIDEAIIDSMTGGKTIKPFKEDIMVEI